MWGEIYIKMARYFHELFNRGKEKVFVLRYNNESMI